MIYISFNAIIRFAQTHEFYNQLEDRITLTFDSKNELLVASKNFHSVCFKYLKKEAFQGQILFPNSFLEVKIIEIISSTLAEIQQSNTPSYSSQYPSFVILNKNKKTSKLAGFTIILYIGEEKKNFSVPKNYSNVSLVGSQQDIEKESGDLLEIFSYTTNNDNIKNYHSSNKKCNSSSLYFESEKVKSSEMLSSLKNHKFSRSFNPVKIKKKTSLHVENIYPVNELANTVIADWLPTALPKNFQDNTRESATKSKFSISPFDSNPLVEDEIYQEEIQFSQKLSKKIEFYHQKFQYLKQCPESSNIINVGNNGEPLKNWTIDTFVMNEKELIQTSWILFNTFGFLKNLSIVTETFLNFLWEVKWHYNLNNNPFHNFSHGLAVAHSVFYLLSFSNLKNIFNEIQQFSLLFSALCHDVGHTGRNNAFEMNTLSKLARRYHDRSILEQHHIALTFKIMMGSDSKNILQAFQPDKRLEFRKLFIANILATDMKEHFDLVAIFKSEMSTKGIHFSECETDKILISKMCLHCCDLSGPAKDVTFAEKWAKLVNQEFSAQVEEEIKRGLPVTPYYLNLDKDEVFYKSESGFIKVIVLPIWELLELFLEEPVQTIVEQLKKNQLEYENRYLHLAHNK